LRRHLGVVCWGEGVGDLGIVRGGVGVNAGERRGGANLRGPPSSGLRRWRLFGKKGIWTKLGLR
jgi:hypothetical protein